jgi:hypothetical protein
LFAAGRLVVPIAGDAGGNGQRDWNSKAADRPFRFSMSESPQIDAPFAAEVVEKSRQYIPYNGVDEFRRRVHYPSIVNQNDLKNSGDLAFVSRSLSCDGQTAILSRGSNSPYPERK